MLIYRSNFITNIFKLKHIIDRGIFLVDCKIKYYSNYLVKYGELIQVHFKWIRFLKNDMRLRFINWNITRRRRPGRYIFINYKYMFIFFIRAPKEEELFLPTIFDLYLGGDIYFL